jgi:hypothetical protein
MPVQTIPGIGPTLAAVLVAEIGDIDRFTRPEQLTCWAGLTPVHHESDDPCPSWPDHQAGLEAGPVGGHNIGVVAAGRRQLDYVFYALRDHHVRALNHPANHHASHPASHPARTAAEPPISP